jgi:hypothetical protein
MINPHLVVMFGGVFATFIGCAVAIFVATKVGRHTAPPHQKGASCLEAPTDRIAQARWSARL